MESMIDRIFTLLASHAAAAAVLALAVAFLARLVRHAAVVHTLWVVVLLKLLTPPLIELRVLPATAMSGTPAAPIASSGVAAESVRPDRARPAPAAQAAELATAKPGFALRWTAGVVAALALGSLVVLGLALARMWCFRRWLWEAADGPEALRRRLRQLASRFGLSRPPRLRVVAARVSPMLWPRLGGVDLLVPRALLDRLSSAELDAVLGHELAHLGRRDHWVRFLELVTTVLFWWHPVLWWARRELRRVEERSCDAWVSHALPGQARVYAEALLKTLEFLAGSLRPVPATATGIDPRHDMKERLTMILSQDTPRRLAPWHRLVLAALAVTVLVVFPTRAEPEEGSGDPALAAEEARIREQALELERRGLELERQLSELEVERRGLDYEREMLQREAEASRLEQRARELEANGQELEAELHRRRQEALERDSELVREAYELDRRRIDEMTSMEQELRAKMLRVEELELAGEHEQAEALRAELRDGKSQLAELDMEHGERRAQLERSRFEHRLKLLSEQRQALLDAGREGEAAQLDREIEALKAESRIAALHRTERSRRRAQELELAQALDKLRELEARGEKEAAQKIRSELEKRKRAWERSAEQKQHELEKMDRQRRLRELQAHELRAQIERLVRQRSAAAAEEREAYDAELAELKKKLAAVLELREPD